MRCKIELIFQGGSGIGCARLVYNITPTGAEVKDHPRSLGPRRRYSALALRAGLLIRHPILEVDCQLGMNHAPVLSAADPLFRDVDYRQIQHFEKAVIGRKHGFRLSYPPELTVEAFDSVGRIDQPSECLRKLKISAEICPVIPPRLRNLGVFLVPVFCERVLRVQSSRFICRCVDCFQVSHKCLQILVRDIFAGISKLMDDAVLDFRLGIDRLDPRRKTGQIIRTGNENILDVLADAGLIFPQHLGVEFALAIPRHRYLYIAKTGAQGFADVPVPAVIRVLVLVVIPVVAQLIVQLGLRTVSHELRDSVLEQFLNIIMLPTFASCSSSRIFSRRAFSSGVLFLLAIVITSSILHLVGGLHKVWDGVVHFNRQNRRIYMSNPTALFGPISFNCCR